MSSLQYLRILISERLTAAAEEIFRAFEETIVEYEGEVDRQRSLLEVVWKPAVKLQRIEVLPQQHVDKEEEEEVLTDKQLFNQERNQEEPEPQQIKEDQEEICISHEEEQAIVKQEADTLILNSDNQKSDHMEPDNDVKNINSRNRLWDTIWKPGVKLHHIELPQQHVNEEVEVLTDQQLCNQKRNQEEPDSQQVKEDQEEICNSQKQEQLVLKHKADTFMLTPGNEESDHMEAEPDSDHQLLSPVSDLSHCQLSQMPTQTSGKPYFCVTCGKHFVSRSYLTVHIRTHTGEKPFSCSTCGKRFNASTNLTKHMKTHTDEKPHSCSVCGKRFNVSTNLTKHMRTHTGEKPYPCNTCGRRFNASPNLKMHMRTHTGEKPYLCNICEKGFTWKATWLDHMRTHQVRNPIQPVGNDRVSQK